jgi:putative transposase
MTRSRRGSATVESHHPPIRNRFRLASKKDGDKLRHDVKPIHHAVNVDVTQTALDDLADTWGKRYPAITRLWCDARAEFIPVSWITTSRSAQSRAARTRSSPCTPLPASSQSFGHFPTEQAVMKRSYLFTTTLEPAGLGQDTMDDAVQAGSQAIAITFGQPLAGSIDLFMETAGHTLGNTVAVTDAALAATGG